MPVPDESDPFIWGAWVSGSQPTTHAFRLREAQWTRARQRSAAAAIAYGNRELSGFGNKKASGPVIYT